MKKITFYLKDASIDALDFQISNTYYVLISSLIGFFVGLTKVTLNQFMYLVLIITIMYTPMILFRWRGLGYSNYSFIFLIIFLIIFKISSLISIIFRYDIIAKVIVLVNPAIIVLVYYLLLFKEDINNKYNLEIFKSPQNTCFLNLNTFISYATIALLGGILGQALYETTLIGKYDFPESRKLIISFLN